MGDHPAFIVTKKVSKNVFTADHLPCWSDHADSWYGLRSCFYRWKTSIRNMPIPTIKRGKVFSLLLESPLRVRML